MARVRKAAHAGKTMQTSVGKITLDAEGYADIPNEHVEYARSVGFEIISESSDAPPIPQGPPAVPQHENPSHRADVDELIARGLRAGMEPMLPEQEEETYKRDQAGLRAFEAEVVSAEQAMQGRTVAAPPPAAPVSAPTPPKEAAKPEPTRFFGGKNKNKHR